MIRKILLTTLALSAAQLLLCAVQVFALPVPPAVDLPQAEIIRLGERIFRDGILPSGDPMPAFIRGDVEIDSSAFSCSSCHLRAGLGSLEGGVVTPPTNGSKLYKPYRRPPSLDDTHDHAGRYLYAKTIVERPAYNREKLAIAMRFGVDPAGQIFNDVMPRYPLSDRDMSVLTGYLEILSSNFSPGASVSAFRFATIITDDVSAEDRQALLEPLRKFIDQKNQQLATYEDFIKFGYKPTVDMKYAFNRAELDIWELKGPPETWQGQLAAYNSKNPVFAVLSGISNGEWRPIHDFCEAERIPCLYPITDLPVISETDWYTFYFNKGYAQEGEATARYLNHVKMLPVNTPILQIVQETLVGKALASGFNNSWQELQRQPVTTMTLSAQQLQDRGTLAALFKKHKPGVLLLWTDAALVPRLSKLTKLLPATGLIFISSGYMGKKTAAIAETLRSRVYITDPYRLTPFVGSKDGGFDAKVPLLMGAKDFGDRRIISRSTTMLKQATLRGLNLLYDNLYRDHLLDIMSTQMDLIVRDYERFSFGPGQRYASKGCYIIQLGHGSDPPLLPRSEWVIL